MTNEKVLSRKKYFSIKLTKALKVYNETFCPHIWMLNSSTNKPKSHLMKYNSEKDGSVSIHHEIQALTTVMFKEKHKLCPEIMSYIFIEGTSCRYNFGYTKDVKTPLANSVYHGNESIAYFGPKIRDTVPDEIKKRTSLNNFQ